MKLCVVVARSAIQMAPSTYGIEALIRFRHKQGYVLGIVPRIAVHEPEQVTGGVLDARIDRCGLPEVPAQVDGPQRRVASQAFWITSKELSFEPSFTRSSSWSIPSSALRDGCDNSGRLPASL